MNHFHNDQIKVFKGPEFDLLSKTQKNKIFNNQFTISNDNNRMAFQLKENLKNELKPIITSLVMQGTVQLTPSGKIIIQRLSTFIKLFDNSRVSSKVISFPRCDFRPRGMRFITGFIMFLRNALSNQ